MDTTQVAAGIIRAFRDHLRDRNSTVSEGECLRRLRRGLLGQNGVRVNRGPGGVFFFLDDGVLAIGRDLSDRADIAARKYGIRIKSRYTKRLKSTNEPLMPRAVGSDEVTKLWKTGCLVAFIADVLGIEPQGGGSTRRGSGLSPFEWAHRAWPILTEAAKQRRTMTYGELAERMNMGGPRPVRRALGPIQNLCIEKNWPALTSIVLSKATGRPGDGFIPRDGSLQETHEKVFSFPWDKQPTPFSGDVVDKLERAGSTTHSSQDFEVDDEMVLANGRGPFQGRFRDLMLRIYKGQCALCKTRLQSMLIGAHIMPWAKDRKNRLNPRNGLLLCRTHDGLFESGLIKIMPSGEVSWYGVTRESLGRDLYYFVTQHTASRLRMPQGSYKPDEAFLQWRLENS